MYKLLHLCLFLLCTALVQAQPEPKVLNSTIEKVVVFVDGAQIIRNAQISLQGGKHELVFRGISPYLSKESIRLEAEGKLTVLSVVHQPNFLIQQKKRKEIELLETQKDKIRDQINREESYLAVFKQEEKMLEENQEIGGENTGLSVTNLREAIDFHRQRLTEVKLKQLDLKTKLLI